MLSDHANQHPDHDRSQPRGLLTPRLLADPCAASEIANTFADPVYPFSYELLNLFAGNSYQRYARTSLTLGAPQPGDHVLDLGCGSGISTREIFSFAPSASVVGVDSSLPFLRLAAIKFGLFENYETALSQLMSQHFIYPAVIEQKYGQVDLKEKLLAFHHGPPPNLSLYLRESSDLEGVSESPFDHVLASQCYHWFRLNGGGTAANPNLDYESKTLAQIHAVLKPGGLFSFNTTGASYRFDWSAVNDVHHSNNPFHVFFVNRLRSDLGMEASSPPDYLLDSAAIEQALEAHGFEIIKRRERTYDIDNDALIAICLFGGRMQIFQREGLNVTSEEADRLLYGSLTATLDNFSPSDYPVVDTGVHYLAKRI